MKSFKGDSIYNYPLSLLRISQPLLDNGFDVKIIDQRYENNFYEKLKDIIKNDVVCVGITCLTGENTAVYEVVKNIKEINNKIPIIVGGYHPTAMPEQIIECEFIDFIVPDTQSDWKATFSSPI